MTGMKINEKAAVFVTDWRKRTEKKQKRYIVMIASFFVVAIILCFGLFFWFQNKNYDRIVKQNMKYVQDSAIQEANHVEREMKNGETLISNLAVQYAAIMKYNDNLSIEDKLILLLDKEIFDRIAFISEDGTDTSLEGEANVSDRKYFKNAMKGMTGWEPIDESRVTGKPTVVFYSPIIVDGATVGVMAGFYEQARLDSLFSYQLFNYNPDSYLMLGDGSVVATSNDVTCDENMLETLSHKKYIGENDYEMIKEVMADSNRATITFSFSEGKEATVGVIVQFKESDWMILSLLPNDITSQMIGNANRIGKILLASVMMVFIVLVAVMMFFFERQKHDLESEIALACETLEKIVSDEEKQISIIESLGEVYSGLYYIDLATEQFQRIKENEPDVVAIPNSGDINEGFDTYVENFVADEYKKDVRKFLDIKVFRSRLGKNGSVSIEYQRNNNGWRRGTLVSNGRDENGNVNVAIFAVQKIDIEKQKELNSKKALEEAYKAAQVASEAKTTFLSSMSHDIRTPMNAIVGMTAIAAASIDNTEKVSDCLRKITSSSRHLLGLINEVLDMSKIESGKIDLCDEKFSLSDLIDNLISINQPLIKEKNHTLLVKINNVAHENVIGDSIRLQQVFMNIMSNAIKYTPEGGKIEITVSEKETNKATVGWYEVVFSDNGIGMSDEFRENLFEPFSRAKDERITNIQGTGLGMPIAKNIIKMMNGDISVESKINEGSKFTVSFVLKLQTEEKVDYANFVDLPVLVVDDDVVACESTCAILNSLSMNSEFVTTGYEAVELTAARHDADDDFYAVIVDWKMPDMNGIETTREIRKRVGDEIPIIVISAYDWTDIEQEAREAGANAFLSKPLFKSRVVSLFDELLGKNVDLPQSVQKPGSLKEELSKYDFSGRRVLIVEDNELNAEIVSELLQMVGVETETAENGKVGVDKFSASEPGYYDMIFMDVQMPVMSGYDAASAIRALTHPDAAKIPIVAMTANAFASDVQAALNSGMNAHISKPIDIFNVIKVMNENMKK